MSYYITLNIKPNASQNDIKRAYKILAKKHHPDKGGNEDKFKSIAKAYEILSKPKAREIYNTHGADGADDYINGHFNKYAYEGKDFNHVQSRGKDTIINIDESLESFYNGKIIKYHHIQKKICFECSIGHKQIDCKTCDGKKTYEENRTIIINLQPGADDNNRTLFPDWAHETCINSTGDLIVFINQSIHDIFSRWTSHLILKKDIELSDALCGWSYTIKHLDGTSKLIQEKPLRHFETTKVISKLGMPMNNSYGELIIRYTVLLPYYRIPMDFHPYIKILFSDGENERDDNEERTDDDVIDDVIFRTRSWSISKIKNASDFDQCRLQ